MSTGPVRPFVVAVDDADLADLADRIRRTRWPYAAPGPAWGQGADVSYLRALLDHWVTEFDWRAAERGLNGFDQFTADVDGVSVHFVHQRAARGDGVPLILTHGWPSTFAEFLPLVPLLTDPRAHGRGGPAFDVVIPSLPGYGFSARPDEAWTVRDTARLWHRLMDRLGYPSYGAHGGDIGSAVSTFLALDQPDAVIGLHLTNLDLDPYLGPGSNPLTEAERAYVEQEERWAEQEGGYYAIQSTRPQSLAFGLTDSPAGLAAWVLDKWRSWSDSGGNLDSRFSRDFLLTTLTLYWVTASIGPSMRDYTDNASLYESLTATERVRVPTAIGLFHNEYADCGTPPLSWPERLYDVRRWTVMPRGGHFAAVEEPDLLADDIAVFFGDLTT